MVIITILSYSLGSCRKRNDYNPTPLIQVIPDGFPQPKYRFENNPLTKEGFELGRRLFYEGRLSKDGQFPCASCHESRAAFGTYEHDRSHGYNNSHTLRNAPVLFNLAWYPAYHWDGEYNSLEAEAVHPVTSGIEMAETFSSVIMKLQLDKEYQQLFKAAFGTATVSRERIVKALSQFTGYMTSADSKYDRVKKGQAAFTVSENNGYSVYQTYCAACHPEPLFTDFSYRNIGLPIDNFLNDYGRKRITAKDEDNLKFRVPTLRNLSFSANFFHDGRFNTLNQVLNHYRTGVQPGPGVDPLVATGIAITNTQAADLINFLKTLADSSFIKDTRYQMP